MSIKTIFHFLLGSVGVSFIGFITLPILTWFFSVEDIGKISMLQIVSNLFVLIFCLGLDQSYVRMFFEEDNKILLFKLTFLSSLILGFFVLIGILIYDWGIISRYLYGENSIYLSIISAICLLSFLVFRFLSLVLRMQEKALLFSLVQIFQKLFFLLAICFYSLFFVDVDIYGLVLIYSASVMVGCVSFLPNIKCEILGLVNREWDYIKFKGLLYFGFPLVFSGLSMWGLNTMDRLFLREYSSFTELGLYSVAFTIVGAIGIFTSVFNTIWAPLIYQWTAKGDINMERISKISECLLAFVYFTVVLIGLFSWVIPYFFPSEYQMIQYLIVPCVLAPLFYTLSETTSVGIMISKKTKFSMYASFGAMLCNFIGNLLLVPKYGAVGASVSTSISFWLFYILRTEISKLVWENKLGNQKVYFIITLLVVMSIIHVFSGASFSYILICWFCLLILGLLYFGKILRELLIILRLKVKLMSSNLN